MSFNLRQINNQQVRAIPLPFEARKPVRGSDVCSEAYANIFCVAKKKSGKSSAVFHLLKECTSKKTTIIVFCSTLYKDKNWIAIRKWIEKRGNPHEFFTSIYQDGEDQIKKLVDELSEEARMREEEQNKVDEEPQCNANSVLEAYFKHYGLTPKQPTESEKCDKKERKDKYLTPEYFIVFDDIGDQLKSPSLLSLLRQNRHYQAKVVISSQYLNHLLPESRKQLDLFIIFKGQPTKKLEEIYRDSDLSIPFEQFAEMYKLATEVKPFSQYPFFYVDTRAEEFRRNFNTRIDCNQS